MRVDSIGISQAATWINIVLDNGGNYHNQPKLAAMVVLNALCEPNEAADTIFASLNLERTKRQIVAEKERMAAARMPS
jgi:hypothetical protein